MYCLCLKNDSLNLVKSLNYIPVGLGESNFSNEWLRDNTLTNISSKNKHYGEYTFHYWFWKNILPKLSNDVVGINLKRSVQFFIYHILGFLC